MGSALVNVFISPGILYTTMKLSSSSSACCVATISYLASHSSAFQSFRSMKMESQNRLKYHSMAKDKEMGIFFRQIRCTLHQMSKQSLERIPLLQVSLSMSGPLSGEVSSILHIRMVVKPRCYACMDKLNRWSTFNKLQDLPKVVREQFNCSAKDIRTLLESCILRSRAPIK